MGLNKICIIFVIVFHVLSCFKSNADILPTNSELVYKFFYNGSLFRPGVMLKKNINQFKKELGEPEKITIENNIWFDNQELLGIYYTLYYDNFIIEIYQDIRNNKQNDIVGYYITYLSIADDNRYKLNYNIKLGYSKDKILQIFGERESIEKTSKDGSVYFWYNVNPNNIPELQKKYKAEFNGQLNFKFKNNKLIKISWGCYSHYEYSGHRFERKQ